jgi:hypothetical protein
MKIMNIMNITELANKAANQTAREHEGQFDERVYYFEEGVNELVKALIPILMDKMNPDNSISAKEYWYRCGINDVIEILKASVKTDFDLGLSEKATIEKMNNMCDQSLDPGTHNKWEEVKSMLFENRKALK